MLHNIGLDGRASNMDLSCECPDSVPEHAQLMWRSGDSYTTTGFNLSGDQPSPTNPLGNPAYPGWTASNGPNWVDYITVKYNSSVLLTYDIAYGGATIDSALVAPYLPTVSSVAEQIENEWFPSYASKPASAKWSSDDTLFAIFDGINDVGNSWFNGVPATTTLNNEVFAVFHGLVDELYYAGARNFAFLNVPPVDRAPLTLVQSQANQREEKADILAWNTLLIKMAHELKDAFPDINVFTVDANKIFTQILDNPKSNRLTAGYLNTTAYCVAYEK
jgi:phospholipase/lecithinase/hemolysin